MKNKVIFEILRCVVGGLITVAIAHTIYIKIFQHAYCGS